MPFPSLDPVIFEIGPFALRWYALAYIAGLMLGWRYVIMLSQSARLWPQGPPAGREAIGDLLMWITFGVILGGRLGYVIFYNFNYYINNPLEIIKIWEGGMSFHGALIGIILGTYIFSKKNKIKVFFFLDIIACVAPLGIFLGRIANFINSELVGKVSNIPWSVIFPLIDESPRHPSQIYEALLEGIILFYILRYVINRKGYKIGNCSCVFLIGYGLFRIISELFREPDAHIGYLFGLMSTGTFLSIIMIFSGLILFNFLKKK